MSTKLVQKDLFRGTREFEILDDAIHFRLKTPFKEEKLTVMLTILNPEPVVNKPYLDFHSRVKCDALISLYLNKPNKKEFDAFVDELIRRSTDEYNAFAGLKNAHEVPSRPEGLKQNSSEAPPEFDDRDAPQLGDNGMDVRPADLGEAINMIKTYLDGDDLIPMLDALKALQDDPQSQACFQDLVKAFDALGPRQGAVLTYAPYIGLMLSDDPMGF